jgi:acetyl-CoA synthetase
MGTALPGYRLLVAGEDGREVPDGREGELAVDIASSPLYWFSGYFRDRDSTGERFAHGPGLYLTADTALAADGLLYFSSRADDVITTSGYRVGPFEVESALLTHPAVADVAVVGTRDALRGEVVTAYVVLTEGGWQSDVLAGELQDLVRSRLSKHSYPRRVIFSDSLPRTPSGKVQRALLREPGGLMS